jgi:ribosome-binding protein aMBF1 (putative translation factor)
LTRGKKVDKLSTVRTNLTRATLRAVERAPCSTRALAKAAGISHGLLHRIQRGDYHVTPDVAERLATALEAWGATCVAAARAIRAAARQVPTPRTGRTS